MRRLTRFLAAAILAATVALVLLPWWLGALLAVIGPHFGLTFHHYVREGYGRFRLEQVEIRRPTVVIGIDWVEEPTPLCWLRQRCFGAPPEMVAGSWRVEVVPRTTPAPPRPHGWMPLRGHLVHTGDVLARWLPWARIGPGEVVWTKGQLKFGPATWQNRTLEASEVDYLALKAAAALVVPAEAELRLTAHTLDGAGALALETHADVVSGAATWWDQPATVSARFAEAGWQPVEASLRAEHWDIAGERARVGHLYARLQGGGKVEWRERRLTAEAKIVGIPVAGTAAPPLTVKIGGHGEAGWFIADTLDAELPGLTAKLSQPVAMDRHGHLRPGNSRFTFAADLARLPWFHAQGRLHGEGDLRAGSDGRATADFAFDASGVSVAAIQLTHAAAKGRFVWPRVEIAEAQASTADGDAVTGHGTWDIHAREVRDGVVQGKISRQLLARWLPKLPELTTTDFAMQVSGPWHDLQHRGRLHAADVRLSKLRPSTVAIDWHGHGRAIDRFEAEATTTEAKVTATGSGDTTHVALAAAELTAGDASPLKLVRPATIRWRPEWHIDPLQVAGPKTMVEAKLAPHEADIAARDISSEWLRAFVALPATKWHLDSAKGHGSWANGPAVFSVEGDGSIELGANRTANLAVQARGDARGLTIETFRAAEGGTAIMNASGRLPLVVWPKQEPMVRFDEEAPLALDAATTANPDFWHKLTDLIGVDVTKPEVTAHLTGTWAQPTGEVRVRAARVAPVPGRFDFPWPTIADLDVHIAGDRTGLRLAGASVSVEGQLVRASGSLPVGTVHWDEFIHDPRTLAERATLHVEVPGADLAAVARFFPDYLLPKGRVQVAADYAPRSGLTGSLALRDAASRPLGPLGVLQSVSADVRFAGRMLTLDRVSARMGGQSLTLEGTADIPDRAHPRPRMDVTLRGENLPFIRRMGLLLRGDLALRLKADDGERPTISGTVRLRDSLFLSDLRSLLPSGAKQGEAHAPYFSIEQRPFNTWRLNVAVEGRNFIRIDTTVFGGVASANFKLSGTLGDPHALGEATIEQGTVRLPFASFDVKQGQVQLTPDHPLEPQLWVAGTARRYGYDLHLEVTGPVSAPNMAFTSSPPLDAEQVVLMVMAGQAPHNEIATTDRQRATRFGAYFGKSLLGSLGGDVSSGADRLTISSGEDISVQGHETYQIEYKLNDRWSLTGEYDEFDEYYGGVKWRVYTKGGKHAK